MFHGSLLAANFLALYIAHIRQHAQIAKIALGQHISAQGGGMVSRQGDQVMKDARPMGRILLKPLHQCICFSGQFGVVELGRHQALGYGGRVRIGGDIPAGRHPFSMDLLAKGEGPVETG